MEDLKILMKKCTIIYFNGLTVKDRNHRPMFSAFNLFSDDLESKVKIDFWDDKNKILSLKSKY